MARYTEERGDFKIDACRYTAHGDNDHHDAAFPQRSIVPPVSGTARATARDSRCAVRNAQCGDADLGRGGVALRHCRRVSGGARGAPLRLVELVRPKYFETLGTPLLAGRDFAFADEGRPRVAIVSRSMAAYLADQVDASIVPERLIATLSGMFGALGAALAAIGLYGLLAYTVARRINEIGVRMALGATRRDVMRMVMKGALGLVGAGLVVGVPVALWSTHVASSMVGTLAPERAFHIALATLIMIVVAVLAAYVPARRAALVSPMDALHQ